MDAFFASVEQRENPELRGIPIAVGHGIVTTASYEARKFGVKSAMPVATAKKLCPHLKLVPVRKNYYGKVGENATVEYAIVDKGVEIGEGVVIRGTAEDPIVVKKGQKVTEDIIR